MASVSWPCRGSPPHIARPEPSKDSEPLGEHARERNGRASPAAAHRRSRSPSQQRVEGDPRQGGAEERGRKRTASGSPAPRQAGPRPQPAVEEAAAGGAARSVAGGGLQTAMQQDDGPPAHTSTPPAASSPAPNSLLSGGPEAEARAGGGGTGGTPLRAGSKSPVAHEATLLTLCPGSSPRSHPLPSATLDELAPFSPPPLPPAPRSLGPFVFGVFGAQGMRPYMEDRHAIVGSFVPRSSSGQEMRDGVPRSFAAVYDGHNGALAADHAADRLHQILAAEPALRTCTGEGPPALVAREEERVGAALCHAFEVTDREILGRCRAEGVRGGATAVAVVRLGDVLYAAHCGDSRAVLCRGGEPLRLTEDHKPNLPRERKRVEAVGGRVDFARCWRVIVDPGGGRPASGLAVSRAFGDLDFKEPLHLVTAVPDVMRERLVPEDSFVVLASDGLWDVLTDKQACDLVTTFLGGAAPGPELAEGAAQLLVQASLAAGSMDNVTAMVALLRWE